MENKLEKSTNKNYFLDALIIKYIVKDINGNILKDTQNMSIQTDSISSLWVRSYDNSVILYYSGTNCGVGWGNIYLKKLNSTPVSYTHLDVYKRQAKIHSPQDIQALLNFAANQASVSDYQNVYVGMIGATQCYPAAPDCYRYFHYVLRFTGSASDLSILSTCLLYTSRCV